MTFFVLQGGTKSYHGVWELVDALDDDTTEDRLSAPYYGHSWELLLRTVHALDVGAGIDGLKARLEMAVNASFSNLQRDELPPLLWERVRPLLDEIYKGKAVAGEGTIVASIRRMSDERAATFAREIFEIFIAMRDHLNRER